MALKIFLIILALWILLALVGLLAAHLSGRLQRAYAVAPASQIVAIAGTKKSAALWAEDFRPVMLLQGANASPPLLRTMVEVVEQQDAVYFVYYQVWEDEIHPNPIYHKTYRLYRAAYYGSPVRDIEYFEIKVNRQTGEIDQMMFETSPGIDYNVTFSEHLTAYVTRTGAGAYSMKLTRKNGDFVSEQSSVPVYFQGRQPTVCAVTWNHLTALVDRSDASFDEQMTAPLLYLPAEEYAAGKYTRKSHGTFKTEETGIGAAAGLLGVAALVLPLAVLLRLVGWVKRLLGIRDKPVITKM